MKGSINSIQTIKKCQPSLNTDQVWKVDNPQNFDLVMTPFILRLRLNCGFWSKNFWRDATISFNFYWRLKHHRIQVKFEFGDQSQFVYWVMALFWLRFRLMLKLYWFFLWNKIHISPKLLYLTTSHYRPWLPSACR